MYVLYITIPYRGFHEYKYTPLLKLNLKQKIFIEKSRKEVIDYSPRGFFSENLNIVKLKTIILGNCKIFVKSKK